MAGQPELSQRDLRNHSKAIVDAVERARRLDVLQLAERAEDLRELQRYGTERAEAAGFTDIQQVIDWQKRNRG